jgi:hypothetical protein
MATAMNFDNLVAVLAVAAAVPLILPALTRHGDLPRLLRGR